MQKHILLKEDVIPVTHTFQMLDKRDSQEVDYSASVSGASQGQSADQMRL